jgi:hypothetical protein
MSNNKSVKTPILSEPSSDNKSSLLLRQVQANHRLTPVKSTPTSGNKHLQHQLPHSNDAKIIYLVPTDCVQETSSDFERDGLEVYNSPQTNLGAALATLNHLEDSPMVRRLQANVRVAAAQIEERGPGYSRSAASSYSRSRSERPRQRRRSQGPLDPVAEEG